MVKKLVLLFLAVVVIALLLAPVALAAGHTSQDIYNDFINHNGKLTGSYAQAELKAFLNDGPFWQYHQTNATQITSYIDQLLGRSTFPFTGFQMLIAGIVAVALVGGGFALRRVSRQS